MRLMIVSLLALTGCSAARVLDSDVDFATHSQRSMDALEGCIALELSALGPPSTIRAEGKRILTYGGDGLVVAAVTIIEGDPRTIEVRSVGGMNKAYYESISRCAAAS